ncbi:MAG: hypothetical protein ACJ763_07275 [Bdellovibrionia bacterium]
MSQTLKSARFIARAALAAAFVFIGSNSAHAVVSEDWDRPVVQSRMDIVEAQGGMINARQADLIMTRKAGSPAVTGLTLRVDRQIMNFQISKIRREVCGAQLLIGMFLGGAPGHSYRLVVVDHTRETCKPEGRGDLHAFPVQSSLEVLLMDGNQPVLRMNGEPEAVITPQ